MQLHENDFYVRVEMINRWYPKPHINVEDDDWQINRVKVKSIIQSPENKELEMEYGQITLVGNMPVLERGTTYKVLVTKEFNEKFKKVQYNVAYCVEERKFDTKQQTIDFLQMFITNRQIDALYAIHDNPLELMEVEDYEGLSKAAGIGHSTAVKIVSRYFGCKDYGPAYGELGKLGITKKTINKLVKKFKSPDVVLKLCKTNPYKFVEAVEGIGFLKADEIALKNGIDKHSMLRIKAFIDYALKDIADNNGSTYTSFDHLMDLIDDYLGVDTPQDKVNLAIDEMIKDQILWCNDKANEDGSIDCTLALYRYYNIEKELAYHITRLLGAENNVNLTVEEIESKIKIQEEKQGWNYTPTQKYGVKVIADNNVTIIRGYGGTGKSSTVAGLLACLGEDYVFEQCALSGKASVNLTDITGKDGKTIHRLLKYKPGEGFAHNEKNQLDVDMVILDEGSMVDVGLALHLFRAIPTGAKLVILGDTNQLEAIGAGNLLMDMIDSEMIQVVTFDEIHRQGAKSGIIPFSIEVANGRCQFKSNWSDEIILGELQDLKVIGFNCERDEEKPSVKLIMQEYKKMYEECRDVSQISVVLPTNTRGTCTKVVNKLIQEYVLPRRSRGKGVEIGIGESAVTVYRGDRVINLKNNYDLDIYNGNVGEVIKVDSENKMITVEFDGRGIVDIEGKALDSLDLGYAISVHKSQGSTLPYTICCLDYSHFVMLNRQLLYTMVTRAKKKEVLIVESKALTKAVRTNNVVHKQTFLFHFLTGDLEV